MMACISCPFTTDDENVDSMPAMQTSLNARTQSSRNRPSHGQDSGRLVAAEAGATARLPLAARGGDACEGVVTPKRHTSIHELPQAHRVTGFNHSSIYHIDACEKEFVLQIVCGATIIESEIRVAIVDRVRPWRRSLVTSNTRARRCPCLT
jgi:hypothetical protein